MAAEEEGDRLSPGELVSTALLLLIAGFETTVNLIGNGTVALLGEREHWERLGEEPELVPAAARGDCCVTTARFRMTARTATEDVDVGGTVIPKGASVIVAIGGANRDPDGVRGARPHWQHRPAQRVRHLSFSLGIHHCLGATLAHLD